MVAGLEEAGGGRQLPDRHGSLVAGVAPGTVSAVLRHFVAEALTLGDAEVEVFEEAGNAGEETNAADATGLGLFEERADEQAAGSVSFGFGTDDDGANLGQVRTIDVKRRAADELMRRGFDDGEGVDVRADLRVTPGEQRAIVSEAVNELMDGAGVLQLRLARAQGWGCDLVFCSEEGDCDGGRGGRGLCYEGH